MDLGWALNPATGDLTGKGTETQGNSHVKPEAETGFLWPPANQRLESLEAGRGKKGSSSRACGASVAQPTP